MRTAFTNHLRQKQFQAMIGLLVFALAITLGSSVKAEDATRRSATGSNAKDVVVAPVRRAFPKTPTDRELNRLARTATAKTKSPGKRKKR